MRSFKELKATKVNLPQNSQAKINSFSSFNEPYKKGDHLLVRRKFYNHHGLYIGDNKVIHYVDSGNIKDCVIKITSLSEFTKGDEVLVFAHQNPTYTPDEAIKRALSRQHEQKYNLAFNNCEHFVNWCIEGEHKSAQVNLMATFIITCLMAMKFKSKEQKIPAIGIVSIGALALGVYAINTKYGQEVKNSVEKFLHHISKHIDLNSSTKDNVNANASFNATAVDDNANIDANANKDSNILRRFKAIFNQQKDRLDVTKFSTSNNISKINKLFTYYKDANSSQFDKAHKTLHHIFNKHILKRPTKN